MSTLPQRSGAPPASQETHPQQDKGEAGKLPPDCQAEKLGVAFFDLSRMAEWASCEQDEHVAAVAGTVGVDAE